MSDSLNRRNFLLYGGATIAGVTLGETGRRLLARADARANTWRPAAVESWVTSVCRECPAACGVRVRLMDQAPVKLEGNPLCPIARGRLCPKGQAAIEGYYDPDRLTGPLKRARKRGDKSWTKISWDEAIGLLAAPLAAARGRDGSVVAIAAEERGPVSDAWTAFWRARGARLAWAMPATSDRLAAPFGALTGAQGLPVFDLERATYALSFGAPLVEDWLSPVWTQRSYGRFRRTVGRGRGRLVQIDARRSLTARKADEWLPVPVDGHATLAYGIAAVLLREDRVDRRALADLAGTLPGFENTLVARYIPDTVAASSGVPVVTLLRLARELTATPRPLAVCPADASAELAQAVLVLNTLVGALDRPGGLLESSVASPSPDDRIDAADALRDLASGTKPASVVALRDASALRAVGAPRDYVSAFDKCDLVVSFSPYLDEAASVANLVLPTHVPLEGWHGVAPATADGRLVLACASPAVPARLDTRDLLEILHATASKIGGAQAIPASSEEAVRAELDRVWVARRGTPYTGTFETEWTRQLERGGWWVPPAASPKEFQAVTLAAGGWTDPYFEPGQLRQTIGQHGGVKFPAVPAAPPPPMTPAPPLGDRNYPLKVVSFTPAVVNLAGGPNHPVLFELLGQPDGPPWQVWAEIAPATARLFDIDHGATVRVTSASGSIDVIALVVEGTPAGTLAVAYVPALPNGGRWAQLVQADVRQLFGSAAGGSVAVRVARV